MFFFIKEKLDSKGKISIFYEISEKYPRFQRMPMQKCHKIFVQIFPFQNILHLFLKKKKPILFADWGLPPLPLPRLLTGPYFFYAFLNSLPFSTFSTYVYMSDILFSCFHIFNV